MDAFTVGQLAQQAGLNLETIRYYERRGLLREPPRTESGYRQYSEADLWSLQFIGRAKQLGFTLAEIATLMGAESGSETYRSAANVLLMTRAKIEELDRRQTELADTRARLEQLAAICGDPDNDDCQALRVGNEWTTEKTVR
ncbi:MAG TPA: MerR family transcriptional regulator [Acidimicrobiales bacterium]|nr:MerR family transcriptional regulator [Acidimicrobiales bacterium]